MVSIRVQLFAQYAEQVGRNVVDVEVAAPATVGALVARLRADHPAAAIPATPLVAVNLTQARPADPVSAGDEVALLPPLAGG